MSTAVQRSKSESNTRDGPISCTRSRRHVERVRHHRQTHTTRKNPHKGQENHFCCTTCRECGSPHVCVGDHGVRRTRAAARRRSLSNAFDTLVSVTSGRLGAEVGRKFPGCDVAVGVTGAPVRARVVSCVTSSLVFDSDFVSSRRTPPRQHSLDFVKHQITAPVASRFRTPSRSRGDRIDRGLQV